jgi:uncharacterized protein YdeI (YjbR/CyaY-like superfamily)
LELFKEIETCYAKNRKEWRKWLAKNSQSKKFVWLIIYHKQSKTPSVYYDEAVEEALCYGWIDSTACKRDTESKYQYFTLRNLKSNWSRLNRERVEKLINENKMTEYGQKFIDHAKKTGTWLALEDVQNAIIPSDLQLALNKNIKAYQNFESFSKSSKRVILEWILNARKIDTREKRISETVKLAEQNIKANHYTQ